jgi:hypothetical protein
MPKDLTIILDNKPGTLARLGEATGKAGININAICALPTDGEGEIHILVDDSAATRRALEEAGLQVGGERDVLVLRQGVDVVDRPGAAGVVARAMADAGVNIDLIYATLTGDVVLGVDDLEKAKEAQRRAGVPAAMAL